MQKVDADRVICYLKYVAIKGINEEIDKIMIEESGVENECRNPGKVFSDV